MRTLFFILLVLIPFVSFAQTPELFSLKGINDLTKKAYEQSLRKNQFTNDRISQEQSSGINSHLEFKEGIDVFLRDFNSASFIAATDTLMVGEIPGDTLIITGYFTHEGPIYVFNDGVLIFDNATVIDSGDIYVFGNGQLFADSSSLTFPQQYFYQRGLIAVQDAYVEIKNSSFNYSGMSHNLVVGQNATVHFENIHQNDWTTCGLYGSAELLLNGCNISGEYILSDTCSATFLNADTMILWHQLPGGSIIDFDFPGSDSVYNYSFNEGVTGVDGIDYNVSVDSCHTVSWAIMPVNGSDVTIQNSSLRLIGNWFRGGGNRFVHGVFNNSSYINYVAPLSDRNLHLINTDVQTWSMYAFDSVNVFIDSCQLGEVGCQQVSEITAQNFLLDGTGGYFWGTDTTFTYANNVTIYTTARSERNGVFALLYSWLPFSSASAIGNSLLASIQCMAAADPVPYENSVVWMQSILGSDTLTTDSVFDIPGKVWIDQGPQGGWMFFDHYDLSYQQAGSAQWSSIVANQTNEVHSGNLGTWNTNSLAAGDYIFRLTVYNTLGDAVESFKPVILIPGVVDMKETVSFDDIEVFPVPAKNSVSVKFNSDFTGDGILEVYDANGRLLLSKSVSISPKENIYELTLGNISPESFNIRITYDNKVYSKRIIATQ